MKTGIVISIAALAALTAAAMPTEEELAKASSEVKTALKTQIASWQKGDISHADLAALMLLNADKFKDEAHRYACLQAAFVAAARADDATLAANAIERICAETVDFGYTFEKNLIEKALAKVDGKTAAEFRSRLEIERARIILSKAVTDADARVLAKMRMITIPSVSIKPPATLRDGIGFLRKVSVEFDGTGTGKKGVDFVLVPGKHESEPPSLPFLNMRNIRLYDALKILVEATGYEFKIENGGVIVFKGEAGPASSPIGKMKSIVIPKVSFKSPLNLADVVETLRQMGEDYDDPSAGARGVEFVLRVPKDELPPAMQTINMQNISLYDILDLCTGMVGYGFVEKDGKVEIFKK